MTPLKQARATLDGVEPTTHLARAVVDSFVADGYEPCTEKDYGAFPVYSRETVESLLQAHELRIRKQVLLEAEKVIRDYFAFKSNMHPLQVQDLINELRRTADDLEGGK